ncbi:SUKH-4 family immunity protein [Streptomyces chattanoogensis]|uniref:SUKH-4 family immunity protein n=1 Tax=Streptomyces chattanoogensis TaxID=66876 RepID=UPI003694852B
MTHQHHSREESPVQDWLALPVKSRRRLVVTGNGKSAFLRGIAERTPGAVVVDCAGLTANEVALRVCAAIGAELRPHELLRGRQGLRDALRGEHTVLLANAQWAGHTFTSSEPHMLTGALSLLMLWAPGAKIRLGLEWDTERLGAPGAQDSVVILDRDTPRTAGFGGGPGDDGMHPLGVLAACELAQTPAAVYRLVHRALGGRPVPADCHGLAAQYPDSLIVRDDDTGAESLSFRSPGIAQLWRRACPVEETAQRRIVAALLESVAESAGSGPWHERGPVGRYAHRALPAHAALAGNLGEVLADGTVVAQLRPDAVWDALARAYPDGVPRGGIAADIRSLEAQGAWSLSQGEWVAWLHHAAVGAGRTERARQLAESGIGMPWKTIWSHWRPHGEFGPLRGEAGRIDEIAMISAPGGDLLLAARDTTTYRSTDPDHRYLRQEFDSVTGEPCGDPVTVMEPLNESGWVYDDRVQDGRSGAFAERLDDEWDFEGESDFPLPRSPLSVAQGIGFDDTWVLAGDGGIFAVTCHARQQPDEPAWLSAPLIGPRSRPAPPEVPAQALSAARGEPGGRAWLEETFGTGACLQHPEDALPDGISHSATRNFLAEVGLPRVEGFMDLVTDGCLKPVGPDVRERVPDATALYEIGHWMFAKLLLDGATGQVLELPRGAAPRPAGGTLAQFFTMARLFDAFRRGFHPSRADRRDAQDALAHWRRRIDTTVDESDTWEAVLGGHPFDDRTWEIVSKNDRPPL